MVSFVMLDRDGVINFDSKDYIKSPSEWLEIPGSFKALALLSKAGYKIGIATNQSGIARGFYSEETLARIHQKLMVGVQEAGGSIDKIVYCPHLPDANCHCRKPKAGMLHEIANFFNATPKGHYFIGDRLSDVSAAKACGAVPLLIRSKMTAPLDVSLNEIPQFESLFDATQFILHEFH